MAGAIVSTGVFSRCCFLLNPRRSMLRATKPSLLATIRASSSSNASEGANADPLQDSKVDTDMHKLACPICYYPLINRSDQTLASKSSLECTICKKQYTNNELYLDLTVGSGSAEYSETKPAATELFRSPLVSFLYERGWRQNFVWGGFPGPEREVEFEMAKDYLKSTIGGTIVDASCGSGLFSRQFVKSGMYSLVIALDFSENMLRQCDEFFKQEYISTENLILVRADISRLPFTSNSIDAVHAGAALHCWPSPSSAVAEISRVLRRGGVFVATTFILDIFPPVIPPLRTVRQYISQIASNTIYLSEGELEDLCRACGLINVTCTRNGSFVMISATKPS